MIICFDTHAERAGEDDVQKHYRHHGDGEPDYKVLALLHGGVAAREVEAKGLAIIIRIGPPADLKNNRYWGILI